jgi:hypothetical protein
VPPKEEILDRFRLPLTAEDYDDVRATWKRLGSALYAPLHACVHVWTDRLCSPLADTTLTHTRHTAALARAKKDGKEAALCFAQDCSIEDCSTGDHD